MAGTLGDIKARIVDETTRDDLTDELLDGLNRCIADAIEQFATEPWWFTEARVTSNCVVGNEYVAMPSGLRELQALFLVVGNVRYRITKRDNAHIEGLYATPISGQPTDFAPYGATIRLWPTPNVAYQLIWLDVADATALNYSDDTSSNVWTINGERLIAADAKRRLYRDYLSATATDPRVINASQQMAEAYSHLKGETNRRLATGRVKAGW